MELAAYNKLPYPRNLWSVVFRKTITEKNLPLDWNETLTYLFNSLNDAKKVNILLYYFRDKLTIDQISQIYDNSYGPVRQHMEKSILMLQDPSRIHIMEHGLEKADYMRQHKLGFWSDPDPLCDSRKLDDVLSLPIDVLDLSLRPYRGLQRMGVCTIDQLISLSSKELLKFKSIGAGSIDEITRCLAKRDLSLRKDPSCIH